MAKKYPRPFGDYKLLKKLAQGGMAEIFLAQEEASGRICAIKRILPHLAHEEGFIRMFLDEARIVQHLDHANVGMVYAHAKHEGYYFMAMEYVEGHSLLSLAERAKSTKMALPFGLLAFITAELLAGLGHAHNARDQKGRHLAIVHRDVTPQNVMIGYDGVVKLIDFGVAKARSRLTKTEAGFTKGKLSYMSPEQARGEPLDGRSDIFSVGIILYEITTGTRLFNKEGPGGILSAIVNDPIPPPRKKVKRYPDVLEDIVMKALAKNVDQRWQTAEEMRAALNRFARQERPSPGRARLADLVQDLFGASANRRVIEEAKEASEPTPDKVPVVEPPRAASVRVKGVEVPEMAPPRSAIVSRLVDLEEDATEEPVDETRMMELEERAASRAAEPSLVLEAEAVGKRLEETGDSVAVLAPVELEDLPVPEPKEPLRVSVARALTSFAFDLRASWRMYRKRYLVALSVVGALSLGGVAYLLGLGGWVSGLYGSAMEGAKRTRAELNLGATAPDAGMVPTVLVLESNPPGAAITVDGLGAGCVTPCDLTELPMNRRVEVTVSLPGYRPFVLRPTLFANQGEKREMVRLEPEEAGLDVSSDPAGARVSVDGRRRKGETPLSLDDLPVGRPLRVRVTKSGHMPAEKVVVLRDGERAKVHLSLAVNPKSIPPGELEVSSSPAGCAVSIGGQPAGHTPLSGYTLKAGEHTVEVSCEFHAPETKVVDVSPGRSSKLSFSPQPNRFGYITIVPVPPGGTTVKVNGRKIDTWEYVQVVPGRHIVEVENRSIGKSKRVALNVAPDARVRREVHLYR